MWLKKRSGTRITDSLFEKKQFWHGMNMLRRESHEIYDLRVNKVSLSPFDTKRWIAEDGVHTLAYGNKARQLCGWRHNQQLLADEPPLWPVR